MFHGISNGVPHYLMCNNINAYTDKQCIHEMSVLSLIINVWCWNVYFYAYHCGYLVYWTISLGPVEHFSLLKQFVTLFDAAISRKWILNYLIKYCRQSCDIYYPVIYNQIK